MRMVRLEWRDQTVVLSLDRPESLNAISPAMVSEMRAALQQVSTSEARVVIIRGEGRAFSAGADLKAVRDPAFSREDAAQFSADARAVTALMQSMPQAVIAQVHGYCFTGALEIVLAADFIIASEDAVFADTHAAIGRTPAWGLSQRLPRLIGLARAKEMSFTARQVTAGEALAMGMILDAVPLADLDARVISLSSLICGNDRLAIAAYKDLFRHAENLTLEEGLAFEAQARYPRTRNTVAKAVKA